MRFSSIFSIFAGLGLCVLVGCSSVDLNADKVPIENRDAKSTQSITDEAARDNAQAVAPVNVQEEKMNGAERFKPQTVYFDFDSSVIRPEFQEGLTKLASYLRANASVQIWLQGNTDTLGSREYNLALGQRRAQAVFDALKLLGVPESQMEAVSFGKEKPAVPETSDAARAQNRRVEIVYK